MLGLDMLPAVGVHAYVSGGVHAMHTVFLSLYRRLKKKKATGGHFCPSVAPAVWDRYNSKPNLNPKLQLMSSAFSTFKS